MLHASSLFPARCAPFLLLFSHVGFPQSYRSRSQHFCRRFSTVGRALPLCPLPVTPVSSPVACRATTIFSRTPPPNPRFSSSRLPAFLAGRSRSAPSPARHTSRTRHSCSHHHVCRRFSPVGHALPRCPLPVTPFLESCFSYAAPRPLPGRPGSVLIVTFAGVSRWSFRARTPVPNTFPVRRLKTCSRPARCRFRTRHLTNTLPGDLAGRLRRPSSPAPPGPRPPAGRLAPSGYQPRPGRSPLARVPRPGPLPVLYGCGAPGDCPDALAHGDLTSCALI